MTVGFIDPGNWASNLAAGANFGYLLLWMVTFSTIMLIMLQHNVAHLGIATGLCLSEATTKFIKPAFSKPILTSAVLASISTSLAEILGGAIALNMLFDIPIRAGSVLVVIFVMIILLTNGYRMIEKWIIAFVSVIGLSFIYELSLVQIDWNSAIHSWVTPHFPKGSMVIIMSVLGAVVMPHNLFLHSEIIQSRQWNLQDEKTIKKQLNYEFLDTLISMLVGWAINSAMILLAAATFFKVGTEVTELQQAQGLLAPLLGMHAGIVFAVALLFAGIASTITSEWRQDLSSPVYFRSLTISRTTTPDWVAISPSVVALLIIFDFKSLQRSDLFADVVEHPVANHHICAGYLTSSEKVMGNTKQHIQCGSALPDRRCSDVDEYCASC